ncbi:MAG: cobalamin biosynthesis protein CobQ [Gammaproteobacteria bacterium]|nr:cobalamin biosynthesis protein CobQ [Gammaproteobacteria bacterium]|tara:strand:+ start:7628 stop:8437 length:810 start_codon:yes stop_codon:yes gene_type:complete
MRVWSVANQKGGVGKTTTTVALGCLLAAQGKRVLMLDLDPQGSLGSYFGHSPEVTTRRSFDWFAPSGKLDDSQLDASIHDTDTAQLYLVPGTTALATLERSAVSQDGMGLAVSRALARLWDRFDYVIIDSPPTLGVLLVNALAASEQVVVPVQTEFLAIKGVERMLNTLQMINRSRRQPLPYLLVPTLFDRRTQASVSSFRYLRKTWPDHVWNSAIPVDTRLRDASSRGVTPLALDPTSRGIQAYASLLKTLLKTTPEVAPATGAVAHG